MKQKILFTVLNWGLGHATRSIPIIKALLTRDYDVVLASDGLALNLLQNEFPELTYYELTSYDVLYKSEFLLINSAINARKILRAITRERHEVAEIVKRENVTMIITDNRYGSYVPHLTSTIITHQIQLRTGNKLLNDMAKRAIRQRIAPFDRIWVPDSPDRILSGALSASTDPRVRYIGWQSTLKGESNGHHIVKYKLALVLSGPEPQRTTLERTLLEQLQGVKHSVMLVRGTTEAPPLSVPSNIEVVEMMTREQIAQLYEESQLVICRAGYSSIMDLYTAGKRALLIPTPGQPEQEYLGSHLQSKGQFVVQSQNAIDLHDGLVELDSMEATKHNPMSEHYLEQAIDEMEIIHSGMQN